MEAHADLFGLVGVQDSTEDGSLGTCNRCNADYMRGQ